MASDYEIGERFRAISDWCYRGGVYAAGWPNFHAATYPQIQRRLYGHFLLRHNLVHWRDVPEWEYNAHNLRTRFTGAHDYARRQGYQHGFPNFHAANYGQGIVNGTFLVLPGACTWRDVPALHLGLGTGYQNPTMFPLDAWFRGASDYAYRSGFAAAMPNGHYANYGDGWVCGVMLFRHGTAQWADIRGSALGLPDYVPPPPPPPPQPWDLGLGKFDQIGFGFNAPDTRGPQGYYVNTVQNVARDVNDNVAVPLILRYDDDSGAAFGPVTLNPYDATNVFRGASANGTWVARATNISASLLRNFVTVRVSWM